MWLSWLKYLSSTYKGSGSVLIHGMMAHACSHSTWEMKARRLEVKGFPKVVLEGLLKTSDSQLVGLDPFGEGAE